MILLSRMPEFLKTADIKDLIKKADTRDWFNYRSISHISFISKVLGNAVAQQLSSGATHVRCSTQVIDNHRGSVCIKSNL